MLTKFSKINLPSKLSWDNTPAYRQLSHFVRKYEPSCIPQREQEKNVRNGFRVTNFADPGQIDGCHHYQVARTNLDEKPNVSGLLEKWKRGEQRFCARSQAKNGSN